jgi:uncharacterized protein YjgD (DUF1641 family)
MARPISQIERKIPTAAEKGAESLQQVLQSISESSDAIVQFLDILKEAKNAGALDILQGILKNRQSVGKVGLEFVQVAGIPVMAKNAILASQFLSKVDPLLVERLFKSLHHGMEQSTESKGKKTSMWQLATSLRDPEINTLITGALEFMRGMSKEFTKKNEEIKNEMNDTPAHDRYLKEAPE